VNRQLIARKLSDAAADILSFEWPLSV